MPAIEMLRTGFLTIDSRGLSNQSCAQAVFIAMIEAVRCIRRFDYLVDAVRRAGADKLIYGTDRPYLHPGLELEKIRLLHLPPAQTAAICGPDNGQTAA